VLRDGILRFMDVYDSSFPASAASSSSGRGLPSIPFRKRISDIPFGPKHTICGIKLGKGELSISRVSTGAKAKQHGFENRAVSPQFSEALLQLLQKQRLPDLSELPKPEREYLYELLALTHFPLQDATAKQTEKIAKVREALINFRKQHNIRWRRKSQQERLQLLLGEMQAGNTDNTALIQEAQRLLQSLVLHGVLSLEDAKSLQTKYVR
jgi:hypothetical protein